MPRENLAALRRLVAELEEAEREEQETARKASLLDAVFSRIPLPVTIWVASRKGLCVSRKVTGEVTAAWSQDLPPGAHISEAYACPNFQQTLSEHLSSAASGVEQSFVCEDPNRGSCVWTHLIPEEDGIMGISLDLSAGRPALEVLRGSSPTPDRPLENASTDPQEAIDVE